jgi:hypothetical protein
MDGIKNAHELAESWWAYFDYCFSHNPGASICEPFWNRFIAVFVGVGLIAVAFGTWKYIEYRRNYAVALRAQWEREQIDEAQIQEEVWHGDKAYQAELPEGEVLQRIRAGIEQRKREVGSHGEAPTSSG